jgi:hypothetical protein
MSEFLFLALGTLKCCRLGAKTMHLSTQLLPVRAEEQQLLLPLLRSAPSLIARTC